MKKFEEITNSFYHLFRGNRQTGSTSLIKEINKKNDVWIIVKSEKEKHQEFHPLATNVFTLDDLIKPRKIIGHQPRPIIIDPHALLGMLEIGDNEMEKKDLLIKKQKKDNELLSYKLTKLTKMIKTLHQEVQNYEEF